MTDQPTRRRDVFAEIAAATPASERKRQLIIPEPPDLPAAHLPDLAEGAQAAFSPRPIFDEAALAEAMQRLREHYAPFMRDLAPPLPESRQCLALDSFDWRLQTPADLADFLGTLSGAGDWERVSIPHYGGPIGRATAYYRTTFDLTPDKLENQRVFVHFKGVDYKAHVFLNGAYLGSHEGFFAPFEFDFTDVAHPGPNTLLVRVENDAISMGNDSWGPPYEGDKIYAASGPGWDDPEVGWHHCPPGMGIYQDVFIESRPAVHIHDVFVRPLLDEERAEAWIEVYNTGIDPHDIRLSISVYGQNFEAVALENAAYDLPGPAGPTVNYYRLPVDLPDARVWTGESPWLYQLQVTLTDDTSGTVDYARQTFGMRSFTQDMEGEPRGRYYLNGAEIKLRGANTMGHMQQHVINRDWDRLRDDILLCKAAHMNFFRLTQRPVQPEIYAMCDQLGMMTQTDLPLFGVIRRNQYAEVVRQAGEMERLVRAHPCNISISYINEAFPNGHGRPHRFLTRPEMESLFEAASHLVRLHNPDRVIKYNDGDYDPPDASYPDNHCYCGWYNGHGVDLGRLHRGYWQAVKPGWMYGCGEFGSEGLDFVDVMRRYYPAAWLPQTPAAEATWNPDSILKAQTGRFHYMWFETQHTLTDWVTASQAHQAWTTRLMTDAFRRDSHLNSCAIHLGIDAFPAGWMKAIADYEGRPKPAWFAYRESLTPLMVSLRSDRFAFFSGEAVQVEAWVCNDTHATPDLRLHWQLEIGGQVLASQSAAAVIPDGDVRFQGFIPLDVPHVETRTVAALRAALIDGEGMVVHDTAFDFDIYPPLPQVSERPVLVLGEQARRLVAELGLSAVDFAGVDVPGNAVIVVSEDYRTHATALENAAEAAALVVLLELEPGTHVVAGTEVQVLPAGMNPRHFVSIGTGHALVADFQTNDLRFLYDADAGYVTPCLHTTLSADGWDAILMSGNGGWQSDWSPALAAGERDYEAGQFRICQMQLAGRVRHNPPVALLARRLLGLG